METQTPTKPAGTMPTDYAITTLAELSGKIAKMQSDARKTNRICGNLPPIAFQSLYLNAFCADARVCYGSESLPHDRKIRNETDPLSIGQILALMEALPPIPLVHHKDGCVSIRPTDYTNPAERAGGERTDILPFKMAFEVPHDRTTRTVCTVEWFADLPKPAGNRGRGFTADRVAVQCVLRPEDVPVRIRARCSGRKGDDAWYPGHGWNITYCELETLPGFRDPQSMGAERIRWANGGNEHPNLFCLYFPQHNFTGGSATGTIPYILGNLRVPVTDETR